MDEDILNVFKNNSNTFDNTKSENPHNLSLQQNADENVSISTNENGKGNASTSGECKLPQAGSLENILHSRDHENRSINYTSIVSMDTTQEDQQRTCKNCIHHNEFKYLGCTNNATYGVDSSSSESEVCPSTAEAEVELELELLSLVAELSHDRHQQGNHGHACCHGSCSRNTGCWNACREPAINNRRSRYVKHIQEGTTACRGSLVRKEAAKINELSSRRAGLPSAGIFSNATTMCPGSRDPGIPGVNVGVEQKQCHLFAGGNVNGSSHVTDRSVTVMAKVHPLKDKSCEQVYREQSHSYIPAKYLERQNVATLWEDHEIPLCPTTENYWETAASEPVTSLFHLASNEEDECCEQSRNNTCGCNNVTCDHFVHPLNQSGVWRVHQGGNYVDRIQTATKEVASGSTDNTDECCSGIPSTLDRLWKEPKRKLNQKLTSLNTLTNARLASAENKIDRGLVNTCSTEGNKMSDTMYKSHPHGFMAKGKCSQRPGSIHLSVTQQKGSSDVQRHLLDVSKYKRKCRRQEIKSQPCQSFSKTFPTADFNEIFHKSNESLDVMPKDDQENNYSKRLTSFKLPKSSQRRKLAAVTKEAPLCQIQLSDSIDRLSSHPVSVHENSTDNKNIEMELTYPLWCSRMQSFMQRIRNPLQHVNYRRKRNNYHRLKHSRTCRRRRGINGAAGCNKCLLEMSMGTHASLRNNTVEERDLKQRSRINKVNRSKYSKQGARKRRLSRNCRRTKSTRRSKNGRISNYTGGRRRRCPSSGWKRRRCKSSFRRRGCKHRCTKIRRGVLRSKHTRKVSRRRRIQRRRVSK